MALYSDPYEACTHKLNILKRIIAYGFNYNILSQFIKDKPFCGDSYMNNGEKRLIHVVRRISNLECGTFGNISDDLGYIEDLENQPPMIKMAYAYARRTVAAGLFYQGWFHYDAFRHVCTVFYGLQLTTGQSVQFQEDAAKQAEELLLSCDRRFNNRFIKLLNTMAISNQNELDPVFQYPRRDFEETMNILLDLMRRYGN